MHLRAQNLYNTGTVSGNYYTSTDQKYIPAPNTVYAGWKNVNKSDWEKQASDWKQTYHYRNGTDDVEDNYVSKHSPRLIAEQHAVSTLVQITQSSNEYDVLHDVQWFGTNSLTHSDILQNDPISFDFAQDVNFTALIVKPQSTSLGDEVTQHVADKIGRNTSMFVLSSYDISWIYGTAMLQAQSDRASDIKPILEQVVSEYDGALGNILLNEYGDIKSADYTISTIMGSDWIDTGVYTQDDSIIWYP